MIEILPTDAEACPDCGKACLVVAFWDDFERRARTKLVMDSFSSYPFKGRDYKGHLIVDSDDKELVMRNSHFHACPAHPNPPTEPADPDEEEKPRRSGRKARW